MSIALLTYDEEGPATVLSWPGVTGGGLFRRQTPDDAPFASTLGGRSIAIVELGDAAGRGADRLMQMAAASGGTAVATFTRLCEYGTKSDLTRANIVLLVMVNNTDSDHDADFNRWYDETHLPDVVNAGGFTTGVRYRRDAGDGAARYLAIYESESTDSAQARAGIIKAIPKMVLWPHLEQVHVAGYARVAL